jgi:hypothetical protein
MLADDVDRCVTEPTEELGAPVREHPVRRAFVEHRLQDRVGEGEAAFCLRYAPFVPRG